MLTSNGTRELSDALRRRCLYHYVDYPDVDREARIILARIAGAGAALSLQIARMVESIRKEELRKVPGVAETLDWAAALVGLDVARPARGAGDRARDADVPAQDPRGQGAHDAARSPHRLLGKVA